MLSGIDDPGESRMGEISMSGFDEGEGSGGHWPSGLSFRAFLSTLLSIAQCGVK